MQIFIGVSSGTILALIWGLVLFGMIYNMLIGWAARHGYTEGYLSLVVATGVSITLIAVSLVDLQAALLTLIAFIASGTPMIIGSMVRYIKARDAAKRAIKAEVHDKSARVAE